MSSLSGICLDCWYHIERFHLDFTNYDICLYRTALMRARPHRKRKNMTAKGVTHVLVCAQELPLSFPKRFKYRKLKLVRKKLKGHYWVEHMQWAIIPMCRAPSIQLFCRQTTLAWPLRVILSLCSPGFTRYVGQQFVSVVGSIGKLTTCTPALHSSSRRCGCRLNNTQSNTHAYVSGAAEWRLRFGALRGSTQLVMLRPTATYCRACCRQGPHARHPLYWATLCGALSGPTIRQAKSRVTWWLSLPLYESHPIGA